MNDTAIILTAFGTSTEARATYDFFEAQARERFPQHDIHWAYTSRTLRAKMALKGILWRSPEELLRELPERGYRRAVIQSLHIVPGKEFDKIAAAAAQAPLPAAVGKAASELQRRLLAGSRRACRCIFRILLQR